MMTVLGIESSCDETAAAIVRDGTQVLSSVVYTQIALHQPYGGVVPEIASRSHLQKIQGVIAEAVQQAKIPWDSLDAVAVTYGPGLASSLIVGLHAAKGIATALGKPLIGINHLEGHIHSVFLDREVAIPDAYPLLALVVSGGNTVWVECPQFGAYHILGSTLDDAAGEAFDKAAKLLGLGYPGGPVMDRLAGEALGTGDYNFPRGTVREDNPNLGGLKAEFCVSFSGLKTSLMRTLQKHPADTPEKIAQVARAYQEAIISALTERTYLALASNRYKAFVLGGGVSLNKGLRQAMETVCEKAKVPLLLAKPCYCGDNAAMIAGLASLGGGVEGALDFDVVPSLQVGEKPQFH